VIFIATKYELLTLKNAVAKQFVVECKRMASLSALIGCSTRITSDMVSAGPRPEMGLCKNFSSGQWLVIAKAWKPAQVFEGGQRKLVETL